MKHFELEPGMLTMRGVFYPTGYIFALFPSEQDAREAQQLLQDHGTQGESLSLLTPQDILEKVAPTAGHPEDHLPSPGTEAQTAQRFGELARQGHHALLIHAPSQKETTHVMDTLKDTKVSLAEKYRQLVIEDLA